MVKPVTCSSLTAGGDTPVPNQKNAAAFAPPPEILIKKYANRRLYDTVTSRYITLSELSHMIRDENHIRIEDAKTGEDLTRLTFIQIIQDFEQDGQQILPVEALRQIILAYGSGNESLLSRYLERTMASFARHHMLAHNALETAMDVIRDTDSANHALQPQATNDTTLLALSNEIAALRNRLDTLEGDER